MNRAFFFLVSLFFLFTSSSCNLYHALGGRWDQNDIKQPKQGKKQIVIKETTQPLPSVAKLDSIPEEGKMPPPEQLSTVPDQWIAYWQRHTSFTSFSAKATAHFEGNGQNRDFTANIRIVKDQKIWISVTALGLVEVARALITPDSVLALDRIHKTAYLLPFSEAHKLFPIPLDFASLQSLLVGDMLPNSQLPTSFADASPTITLTYTDGQQVQRALFNKADSTLLQQNLVSPNVRVDARYTNFIPVGNQKIAQSRVFTILNSGQHLLLEMDYDHIEFNKELNLNFSVPAKYLKR